MPVTESQFTTPLKVEHLDGKYWKVCESFIYYVGHLGSDDKITVPVGFITDFASIPRIARPIIGSPTGEYGKAAVVHDFLYAEQTRSRLECDRIFLEAMVVLKVAPWKRRTMYTAVRMFGWLGWRHHKKQNLKLGV